MDIFWNYTISPGWNNQRHIKQRNIQVKILFLYQKKLTFSNMALRLSGQTSMYVWCHLLCNQVFFGNQETKEIFIKNLQFFCHVGILIYRTWPILMPKVILEINPSQFS